MRLCLFSSNDLIDDVAISCLLIICTFVLIVDTHVNAKHRLICMDANTQQLTSVLLMLLQIAK